MRTTGEPPIKPSRKQKKGSDKVEHPPKVEVEKIQEIVDQPKETDAAEEIENLIDG